MSTTGAATIGTTLNVTGQTTLATGTATTPATGDNSTNIATTAHVKAQGYAPLASPTFTGTVTIPSGASIAGYLTTAAAAAGYATVTGGGASGTWGINVSGSAVSATTQDRNTYSTGIATTAYVKNLFGTDSVSGTLDWNDSSNIQPGTGPTLLLGTASNGPGLDNYYHPLNFEYGGKNGTQQITQLAISYASPANELYMRGRYAGSWSSWVRFLNSSNYNLYSPTLTGTGASGTWGINVTGNAANVTGTVAIANGGTGQTSAAAALAALLPSQSGQAGKALVTNGSAASWTTVSVINSGTAVASTSGTAIDFTSIPSGVKRVTVMFNGVSTNGNSVIQVQLGAGSIATTGYTSTANSSSGGGTVVTSSTTGLVVSGNNVTGFFTHGAVVISNFGANVWVALGNTIPSTGQTGYMAGSATLSGTVDRVRITTMNGTDTFDAGSINILYEG